MRRILLLLVTSCICFSSCSWENESYGLSVWPEISNIGLSGGSLFLEIKSNSQWVVSPNEDWLTVTSDAGVGDGELVVLVSASKEKREGHLFFTLPDGKKKIITIRQGFYDGGVIKMLFFSSSDLDDNYSAGGFVIIANQPWTLECEDWVNVSPRHSKKYKTEVLYTVPHELSGNQIHFVFKLENGESVGINVSTGLIDNSQ